MDSLVWQKFDLAADRYDQASVLQQQSARQLLAWMGRVAVDSVWLDAGCGTGVMAKALAVQGARVWAIDQAANMLKHLENIDNIQTIQSDINHLPLADEMLDGVVSNFVLHWLGSRILPEILRVVQPDGDVWLAIPVEGSLQEVAERYPGFPLFPFEPAVHWLAQADGFLIAHQLHTFSQSHHNLRHLIGAIRQMGGDQTGLSASRHQVSLWRQWLQDVHPIDLSFRVLFMHLKKPAASDGLAFLYQ